MGGRQTMTGGEPIEVDAKPRCAFCGGIGAVLYEGLRDGLFNAPGVWNIRNCRGCGLIWLDPQPTANEIGEIYGTYHTHQAARSGRAARFSSLRARLDGAVLSQCYGYRLENGNDGFNLLWKILCRLSVVRDIFGIPMMGLNASWRGRLLDVGCGNGAFLAKMRHLGWETVGVELDEKAADVAKTEFDMEVFIGSLDGAGFADESFDAITLSHVLEHVGQPLELFRQCRRLLRRGGRIVVTTPNAESLGHRLFKADWRGLEVPRHLKVFSLRALAQCAVEAGLSTTILRTSARGAHALYLESRLLKAGEWTADAWLRASARLKLESVLFQVFEEIVRVMWKGAGEELYFEGIKQQ
jgi:2-polyprenyl-3-methyl-5-hydroxy-6-metoxy-1,4-benzoquinol methylase